MLSLIPYASVGVVALLLTCCAASPAAETAAATWQVAPYKVPCRGESLQLCYWVSKNGQDYEYFYDEIEGFHYTWGHTYALLVEEMTVENPPADASSLAYRLREIVEQRPVPADSVFTLPLAFDGQSLVDSSALSCSYLADIDIDTTAYTCAEIAQARAADFRFAAPDVRLLVVALKD